MRLRIQQFLLLVGAVWVVLGVAGCANTAPRKGPVGEPKASVDKVMAGLLSEADFTKAMKTAEKLVASKDPVEREMGLYWKALTLLYRDLPESALVILEANDDKWTGGMRKVHGTLLLTLAREANQRRTAQFREESNRHATDKPLQEKIEGLQKEAVDLKAENGRLVAEKKKYLKLLKDLETIR